MPTTEEFDSAAHSFGQASTAAPGLPSPLANAIGPDVVAGGMLTTELNALIGHTEGSCAADASRLSELADLCTYRAEVCRQYGTDLARYNMAQRDYQWANSHWETARNNFYEDPETYSSPGQRPNPPTRPSKPAHWVEM